MQKFEWQKVYRSSFPSDYLAYRLSLNILPQYYRFTSNIHSVTAPIRTSDFESTVSLKHLMTFCRRNQKERSNIMFEVKRYFELKISS